MSEDRDRERKKKRDVKKNDFLITNSTILALIRWIDWSKQV